MTPAYIRNASGHFAGPTSVNVSVGLKHATLNRDLTQNLMGVYNAPEANAYPLASYSYLITPTSGIDPAKGAVLAKWIIYIACAGQREAAPLGYSPLPPNLVQAVFSAVKRIPGAPATPALTPTACPNPTITGQGYSGSPGSGPSSDPQGTTTTTAPTGNGSGGTKTTNTTGGKTQAAAAASPTGDPAAVGLQVDTLSAARKQAAFDAGVKEAASVSQAAGTPQLLAAALLVALVAAPLVPMLRRSRARRAAR